MLTYLLVGVEAKRGVRATRGESSERVLGRAAISLMKYIGQVWWGLRSGKVLRWVYVRGGVAHDAKWAALASSGDGQAFQPHCGGRHNSPNL